MFYKSSKKFPQKARLKSPSNFRWVFNNGKKQVGRYFVLFFKPNRLSNPRLGLAVGRRAGNAVTRNILKRLIRENFRQNKENIFPNDLVFIARKQAANANKAYLNEDLRRLFRKIAND